MAALAAALSMALATPALAAGAPVVTRVQPGTGPAGGGTSVTITGTGFTGATAVQFGSTNAATFEVEEFPGAEPYITAVAPPGTGTVDVTVTTPSGTSATSEADRFTYANPPVIEGEGASHITADDATLEAKINTEGAAPGPQSGVWYQFQLVSSPGEYQTSFACPTPLNPSQCFGPPNIAGSLPLRFLARASGGQAVSVDLASAGRTLSPGTTYHFRVIAANRVFSADTNAWEPPIVYGPDLMLTTAAGGPLPTVTNIIPRHATSGGGTSVTIIGTHFTGATAVKFGNPNAESFNVNSSTMITAVSPPVEGDFLVDVTVTTPAGTSATSEADHFGYTPACQEGREPVITSIEPHSGPAGTSVSIKGERFFALGCFNEGFSVNRVLFGFTEATFTSGTTGEERIAVAPPGTGTVDVTVESALGASPVNPNDRFTYPTSAPPPTVTKVEPTSGPAAGGSSVTITGTNLSPASAVKFGSTNATSFAVNSETSITAVSPAGTGAVDVTVTTPGGTSASSEADLFTYGPTVSRIEPETGTAAGGTSVTITGTGFTGATAVKFGSNNATSITVNSASSITAVSPPGTGTVDVTVTTAAGTSPIGTADQFTYGPTVTKVEPNHGSPRGGTTVTMTGTGFNTGASAVNFGTASAKSYIVNSETSITAVSPKGKGTVDVTVTTSLGTSLTGTADQFTYKKK